MFFSAGRWNVPFTAWIWPAAFLFYSRAGVSSSGRRDHPWKRSALAEYAQCRVCRWSVSWILPYIADRLLYKRLPAFLSTLLLPGVFATLEFLRHFTLVGSYGVTAYTQTGFLPLIQSVSVIGSFGLSFLILWFGPVLLYAFGKKTRWQGVLTGYLAVLAVFIIFGCVRLHAAPAEAGNTIRAANIVGPYYRQFSDETYDTIPYEESVAYLTAEAERAAAEGAEVACWNEEAFFDTDFNEESKDNEEVNGIISSFGEDPDSGDTDDGDGGLSTNKLVILQPDGSSIEYIKTHLVPVIETSEYVKGSGAIPTVRTRRGVFSAIICFDDSYIRAIPHKASGEAGNMI